MILEIHVLRDKDDFARLFRRGKKISFFGFTVVALPNLMSYSRFAFIIPNTAEKLAVKRNRLRRRVREWVRINQARFFEAADIAFLFRREVFTLSRKKLYEELDGAISKIFG